MLENIDVTGIIIAVTALAIGAAIAIVAIITGYGGRKMDHEARMKAIEKGTNVPIITEKTRTPYQTFKAGLVWAAVGLGIFISFVFFAKEPDAAFLGIIPFLVGVALLISWIVERRGLKEKEEKKTSI